MRIHIEFEEPTLREAFNLSLPHLTVQSSVAATQFLREVLQMADEAGWPRLRLRVSSYHTAAECRRSRCMETA